MNAVVCVVSFLLASVKAKITLDEVKQVEAIDMGRETRPSPELNSTETMHRKVFKNWDWGGSRMDVAICVY